MTAAEAQFCTVPKCFSLRIDALLPRFRHYHYGLWGFSLRIKSIYNIHMLMYSLQPFLKAPHCWTTRDINLVLS